MRRLLRRLLGKERRRAERHVFPGLVAYYWDGGPPTPHRIREISLSGMFLLTEERWYPGTVLTMRLRQLNSFGTDSEASMTVLARAVRHASDGVGLAFLPSTSAYSHATGAKNRAEAQVSLKDLVRKMERGEAEPQENEGNTAQTGA